MRKRKWFGLCGIAAILIVTGLTALGVAVKHEPNFYLQSQVEPGDGRIFLANQFLSNFGQMMVDIKDRQERWDCNASEAQLNSFFEEIFPKLGEGESLRKLGMGSLVVTLEEDRMRLAFRYGSGFFSTVVSYELKIWLVPKEANTIAVEIVNARAGAVPISSQSILQQLSGFGRKQNKKVNLFRHDGHPVAVIGLQAEQDPHPKWILTTVEIHHDALVIHGRTPPEHMQPLDPSKAVKPALVP